MSSVTGDMEYTGRVQRRLVLVLDCVVANEFTDKMSDLMNLQHYVIHEKRLSEKEAIVIFLDIVHIIDCLHKVSVGVVFNTARDPRFYVQQLYRQVLLRARTSYGNSVRLSRPGTDSMPGEMETLRLHHLIA